MAELQMEPNEDEDTGHVPAQSYSLRVPSPPRIIVRPPNLNANSLPGLQAVQDTAYDFDGSGFANVEFLKTVTFGDFDGRSNMLEWKYEQRRMAQEILPFLYLGPMSSAKDKEFLQRKSITMVLAIRNTLSAQANLLSSRAAQQLGIDTTTIDVAGNQELIAAYPKGIETINAHLSAVYRSRLNQDPSETIADQENSKPAAGRVLVYCESGNERSASLVTAYIMAMFSTNLENATQIVQAQRFAIALDDSLRSLLQTYESILTAKRDVLRACNFANDQRPDNLVFGSVNQNNETNEHSKKRRFDEAQDDDADLIMGGCSEGVGEEGSGKREGRAPFRDRVSS